MACAVVFTPSKSLARDDGAIVGAIIGAAAGAMIAHGLASSARPAPPPHRYRAARPRRQASAPYQGRRAAAGQPSHTAQTHNVSDPFAGAASGPVRRARN
ncbi:MAG TPA: hypothetical protein VNZ94_06020 [Xanthobacteraceae bacterium]|nr:hypothetical protein [Xanthobacteraceae bacterium]